MESHVLLDAPSDEIMAKRGRNVWVDLDNSPHVPFFIPIIERLQSRGYKAIVTARNCFQVRDLANLHGLKCTVVGKHYGKTSLMKLIGIVIRAVHLCLYITPRWPQFAVSHGSRAQLLVCKFLGIPCLIIDDYEHSNLGIRPDWLLVPAVVASSESRTDKARIMTYPGIKEDVYIPRFKPETTSRAELGLSERRIVVTVRPPADEAHYRSPQSDTLYKAVMECLVANSDVQIILLPRTATQAQYARTRWENAYNAGKINIPPKAVNGISLIWCSDLLISGGGTMNREAAALGVPVYSIFCGPMGAVDRGLVSEGRLVFLECLDDIRGKLVLQRKPASGHSAHRDRRTLDTIVEKIIFLIETS